MTPSNEEHEKYRESERRECQRLLMNFHSSQLNTHSRIIIGLSVTILTLVQVVLRSSYSYLRIIPYSAMFFLAFAFYRSFFRLILYGVLSHSVLIAEPKGKGKTLLLRINMGVEQETLSKGLILPWIRAAWFLPHNKETHDRSIVLSHDKNSRRMCDQTQEKGKGYVVCAIFLALPTTYLLALFLEKTAMCPMWG